MWNVSDVTSCSPNEQISLKSHLSLDRFLSLSNWLVINLQKKVSLESDLKSVKPRAVADPRIVASLPSDLHIKTWSSLRVGVFLLVCAVCRSFRLMRPFRVRDAVKSSKSPRGSCGIGFPPGTSSVLSRSQVKGWRPVRWWCGQTRTPPTARLHLLLRL